jgi:hypothetical protein
MAKSLFDVDAGSETYIAGPPQAAGLDGSLADHSMVAELNTYSPAKPFAVSLICRRSVIVPPHSILKDSVVGVHAP